MSGIYIEERELDKGVSYSWDIAHHLYTRQLLKGVSLVVADNQTNMLAAVRKQWMRVLRRLYRERAGTLNGLRIAEFERSVEHMESLRFSLGVPSASCGKGVFFVYVDQLTKIPPRMSYRLCHSNECILS